eukprot:CAMPEP_0115271946 /NCGR_PEP_ID=MMETSP0270-20121206/54367_1 /TAXON_ID=71861 /ORGANISM="Scrippsiella trochoidea, Strain CCMP3099" /LENGTH=138 /DNA_ID=CAMNT_0002688333 /DNA_START=144 /DNA_END=558 /DNA_ORIENTATION=+
MATPSPPPPTPQPGQPQQQPAGARCDEDDESPLLVDEPTIMPGSLSQETSPTRLLPEALLINEWRAQANETALIDDLSAVETLQDAPSGTTTLPSARRIELPKAFARAASAPRGFGGRIVARREASSAPTRLGKRGRR